MGLQSGELFARKRGRAGADKIVGHLVFKDRTLRILGLLLQLFDALLHNLAGDIGRFHLAGNGVINVGVDNCVNDRCRLRGVVRRKSYRHDARAHPLD